MSPIRWWSFALKSVRVVESCLPVTAVRAFMTFTWAFSGITNHDEYSLVREKEDEENERPQPPSNFGTLTLRRRKEGDKEIDPKMEQLKKKLKTDDESEDSNPQPALVSTWLNA